LKGSTEHPWWKTGIIYQIYPRSFKDTNGDGVGDLRGIIQQLDYCHRLGVTALWLSPVYPSPMADFGYDVSDYTGIDPLFGTMEDFDTLLSEAHKRDLRLILDFIPNHSSDKHPWFLSSRSSRDNPYRSWYIWQDAEDGNPPNNWLSAFGGSAWEWDARTEQYYCHTYLKEQPDLNWRNPEVSEAMLNAMRFWLDRGVDGFRIDAIAHVIKNERLCNNPPNPEFTPDLPPYDSLLPAYSADQPELHDVIGQMRAVIDEFPDRLIIGEAWLSVERMIAYHGSKGGGMHFPFNFHLVTAPWESRFLAAAIDSYEGLLPPHEWPNWVLGNHDRSRVASRLGVSQARVAAMLLLCLHGTPTMYYGDEIGMQDVPIGVEHIRDPYEKNIPGKGLGRDPSRSPMQWDRSANAGFSDVTPWLPVHADFERVNVEKQREDRFSLLTLYTRLIALRSEEPALQTGRYAPLVFHDRGLAFERERGDVKFVIALNFSGEPLTLHVPSRVGSLQVALSTGLDREGTVFTKVIPLRKDEGLILRAGK
jgi:alpha-glucosidase